MPDQSPPVVCFEIPFTRYLDKTGIPEHPLPPAVASKTLLLQLMRGLWRTRVFDRRAVALQRTGRLGTFASSLGQEAVGVGAAAAMTKDDVLVPSYRETAALLARGVAPAELLLYWGGDERGNGFEKTPGDFPICITVGGQSLHAVGAAYAMRMQGEPGIALAVCGDGATSKGDFYEALNMAGVWKAPVVFLVNNNQWAISVPRRMQTAAETLAQKAIAAGIPGEQVDGNDVIAVYDAVSRARARALTEGPSVIEAITYRLSDHTTSDDATRYREAQDVTKAWESEPIRRLGAFMKTRDWWSKAEEDALVAELEAEVESAVKVYSETPPQAPETMFDYLYETLPPSLARQRAALIEEARRLGDRSHG